MIDSKASHDMQAMVGKVSAGREFSVAGQLSDILFLNDGYGKIIVVNILENGKLEINEDQ